MSLDVQSRPACWRIREPKLRRQCGCPGSGRRRRGLGAQPPRAGNPASVVLHANPGNHHVLPGSYRALALAGRYGNAQARTDPPHEVSGTRCSKGRCVRRHRAVSIATQVAAGIAWERTVIVSKNLGEGSHFYFFTTPSSRWCNCHPSRTGKTSPFVRRYPMGSYSCSPAVGAVALRCRLRGPPMPMHLSRGR